MSLYIYRAKVLRVVDGDTIDVRVDLGFAISAEMRFRFEIIDAPETYRPKSKGELEHGKEATAYVQEQIEDKYIIIKTNKDKRGKYRWVCLVHDYEGRDPEVIESILDGTRQSLNERMIELGLEKLENYAG